jgi:hypothetical protein
MSGAEMTKADIVVLVGTVAAISDYLFQLLSGGLAHRSFQTQQIMAVIFGICVAKAIEVLVRKSMADERKREIRNV